MNRKAVAVLVAKLVLSVGLLVLVLAKVDIDAVLLILSKADPWLVLLWYSLVPVAIVLSAWRWEALAPGLSFTTAVNFSRSVL